MYAGEHLYRGRYLYEWTGVYGTALSTLNSAGNFLGACAYRSILCVFSTCNYMGISSRAANSAIVILPPVNKYENTHQFPYWCVLWIQIWNSVVFSATCGEMLHCRLGSESGIYTISKAFLLQFLQIPSMPNSCGFVTGEF